MTPAKSLAVHYLPQFVDEADLADTTVVVIDLLRASTTICQALSAGATEVRPYLEVGDVMQAAEQLGNRDDLLLGGERGGQIIPGFDLGNSPAEYTPAEVYGKQVLFTTTNGTRALQHARLARRVLVGAIVNLTAIADSLVNAHEVHLLCAGTGGHVTREDQLAAGAIAYSLSQRDPSGRTLNQATESVLGEWREMMTTARVLGRSLEVQLALELEETQGGKNLLAIGMDEDLTLCSAIDKLGLVPEYDPATGAITAP